MQVSRVPYLHLRSLPTWHSRTSSWSLCLKVPQPILSTDRARKPSDHHELKYKSRSQFSTKVILKDGQISLMGEGSPSIAGSLTGKPSDGRLINSYNCDLEDLPMMLLQQVMKRSPLPPSSSFFGRRSARWKLENCLSTYYFLYLKKGLPKNIGHVWLGG